ncbi:gastrula zinc finger protein XlCGF57.1-like isoform X2 [Thalassophryne amazonica]|uniref:gastrula zinc finger protein XlCGF57.1-like isoform X2 n=1 Tax=Thalassophryne amazonica TaxID=390379 RepID=UPI001470D4D1|nr:gastrula zinc finger protein XlCGF57.1-like isoform X2 [Thalassophryne amazonica]
MQQLLVNKEDVLPEQEEWNRRLDQKGSKPPNIKEEQEDLWSEDEEKPQSSQLHQNERDEVELLPSNSTEHKSLKIEAKDEDCGGSQPATGPCSRFQPHADDMQKLIKEEILPKQRDWNLNDDQKDIKEEQVWINHQGQQLHQLEEADITKFPFTAVFGKSESDDENPLSSQVHQSQTGESTEAEPVASTSTVHRALTAQADGEDDEGPKPTSNSGLYSNLQPDTNGSSDSSETETDDSYDWKQTRDLSSGLNCLRNSNVSISCSSCNISETQLNFCECGKVCSHLNHSKQHRRRQANEKPFSFPFQIKKWRKKSTLNKRIQIHTGETLFGCSECGKSFGEKGSLTRHMRIHTGQKPFNCLECDKRFGQKGDLIRHMRIHTGQKPFSCSQCDKSFGQKGGLNIHMRIHTGQKPFDCLECGKRFGQKSHLNMHMRIHTRQKPFSCSECGKKFGRKGYLNIHMRIHTGQKPFLCSECGKRFGQKGDLITHMRIHSGQKLFGCSQCGKKFGRKCDVIRHMRIHTGQKPFRCSECGKRFGQKGDMVTHMRIHTGQKPFGCSRCGKKFGRKGNLMRHMRIHTVENIDTGRYNTSGGWGDRAYEEKP